MPSALFPWGLCAGRGEEIRGGDGEPHPVSQVATGAAGHSRPGLASKEAL